MKGFAILVMFSIIYILLMMLIQESMSDPDPRGVGGPENLQPPREPLMGQIPSWSQQQQPNNAILRNVPGVNNFKEGSPTDEASSWGTGVWGQNSATNPNKFPDSRDVAPPSNSSNPFVQLLQIEDAHTRNMMDAAYGSYQGNDQCMRKSACIAGNYMTNMPGRDLMFVFLGGYIPTEYSLFYDIFRNSAMYGQNCDVYVCQTPNDQKTESANSPPR